MATIGILQEWAFAKMLIELRVERDQLAEAILTLERLAAGRGKRTHSVGDGVLSSAVSMAALYGVKWP